MAFLILFIIALGIGAILYARWRQDSIPIGYIGVMTYLGARTSRVYGEGKFIPLPFCNVIKVRIKGRNINLQADDISTRDGIQVVLRKPVLMFELLQADDGDEGVIRHLRLNNRLWRRVIPYKMDDRLARYLNIDEVLEEQMEARAHSVISDCGLTAGHAYFIGYHVIKIIDLLIAGESTDSSYAPLEDVQRTRRELNQAVVQAITDEFGKYGVTEVRFAYVDIDPTKKQKDRLEQTFVTLGEIQSENAATVKEVSRTMLIVQAVAKVMAENPGIDFMTIYGAMRKFDISKIAAENGVLGGILQEIYKLVSLKAEAATFNDVNTAA